MNCSDKASERNRFKRLGKGIVRILLGILAIALQWVTVMAVVLGVVIPLIIASEEPGATEKWLLICFVGLGILISTTSWLWLKVVQELLDKLDAASLSQQPKSPPLHPVSPKKEPDAEKTQHAFLVVLGSLMGLMAKADGHVDESEIRMAEKSFDRLGLNENQKALCVLGFRQAQRESFTAADYGRMMVTMGFDSELRLLAYEILWDIACADGVLVPEERDLLKNLASALLLPPGTFRFFHQHRIRQRTGSGASERQSAPPQHSVSLEDAYQEMGCSPSDSDDTLRKAYHELVKKLHPDILRAQGVPESLMDRANARMARINAAWKLIKRSRQLS